MSTGKTMFAVAVVVAASSCASQPSPITQPVAAPAQAEMKGCYYAGELFSIGAVKPSMSAAPSENGGTRMIDDPATAVPLTCVMQFDGTHTTFVWVVTDSVA
jgi:hypothetical protein